MAGNPVTNTYVPTGPGGPTGEREDLRDVIEMLTPEETPFYSNTRKVTAKGLQHDWLTQMLNPISVPTPAKRGFESTPQPAYTPERLFNYCELIPVEGSVADSFREIDTAGRADELDYQKLLHGKQLRLMIDALMFANQAKSLTPEPSYAATLPTFISGNRFKSVKATPGTPAPGGNGSATYTPGTGAAGGLTTIDHIDDVLEACYATNGMPTTLYMNPSTKRLFSRLPDASLGDQRVVLNIDRGADPFQFVGTADIYWSDYGRVEAVIDRQCPATMILFVDPRMFEIATLPSRAFKVTDLAKTGSSEKFMIEWEGTFAVPNPTAHGMIEGIT